MKIISEEVAAAYPVNRVQHKRTPESTALYTFADAMEIGQWAHISPEEWRFKSKPSGVLPGMFGRSGKKFQTRTISDGRGWIVKRIA